MSTLSGHSRPLPWTSQVGGEPTYRARAGNSRNRPETGHSTLRGIASSLPRTGIEQGGARKHREGRQAIIRTRHLGRWECARAVIHPRNLN